jgi:hypothetical protein
MSDAAFSVSVDVFRPELAPGETIVWAGKANPRIILHQEDWLAVPFSLLWGGFALFWLLGASGIWDVSGHQHQFAWFGVVFGAPFVLVGQYMIWGRFLFSQWLKRRTFYALTNRRAIVVRKTFLGPSAASASFNNLSMVDKLVRADGIGILCFGGRIWTIRRCGTSWQAWPHPPMFRDIDNADRVYQTAMRLIDESQK